MSEKYMELLRDPRWQRKRLEALAAGNLECSQCHSSEKTLNVHHKRYRRGAKPWEYDLCDLDVRCEGCHHGIHELRKELDGVLDGCDWQCQLLEETIAYIAARVAITDCTGQPVACGSDSRARGVAAALGSNPDYIFGKVVDGKVNVEAVEGEMMQEWVASHYKNSGGGD